MDGATAGNAIFDVELVPALIRNFEGAEVPIPILIEILISQLLAKFRNFDKMKLL